MERKRSEIATGMERKRPAIATLALLAFLSTACIGSTEGSCNGCTIYPFVDSPAFDIIIEDGKALSPAECAETCFSGSTSANETAVAFVIGLERSNTLCWCKSKLQTQFNYHDQRTIVVMGTPTASCRYLFEQ